MSNETKGRPQDDAAEIEKQVFSADWVGKISYWIFHYRRPLLILFIVITIVLGAMASQLRVQAAFTKMIPLKHPYMATFLEYQSDFGGANTCSWPSRTPRARSSRKASWRTCARSPRKSSS